MSESDGMEEAFEGQLRVGLLVAGRVAEELSRMRQNAAREAEARSVQAARELQDRVAAERTMARAALAPVGRDQWWERAQPGDIAAAWQTARTWETVEPDARRAADTIREQARDRYGVDVDDLGERDGALERALTERAAAKGAEAGSVDEQARAAQDRAVAVLLASENAEERAEADERLVPVSGLQSAAAEAGVRAAAADRAAAEGQAATAAAGAAGTTPAEAGGPAYDSPQRRRELAEHLGRTVGPEHVEAIEARVTADKTSARPVTDVAAQQGAVDTTRARRAAAAGRGQGRVVER